MDPKKLNLFIPRKPHTPSRKSTERADGLMRLKRVLQALSVKCMRDRLEMMTDLFFKCAEKKLLKSFARFALPFQIKNGPCHQQEPLFKPI
ncbi:hypothetical protein CPT76_26170 [Paenibacillus sp. AR247]|nr:hypothetical protein CPT76_26170 [Paenibacillus sp. AR247]